MEQKRESFEPKLTYYINTCTMYMVSEDMNWFGFSSSLPELPGGYYPSSSKLGTLRDFAG